MDREREPASSILPVCHPDRFRYAFLEGIIAAGAYRVGGCPGPAFGDADCQSAERWPGVAPFAWRRAWAVRPGLPALILGMLPSQPLASTG